jgi:rhomboid protease GluP
MQIKGGGGFMDTNTNPSKSEKRKFRGISYNAPVVLTFALVSLIALILNMLTNGMTNRLFFSVYRSNFSLAYVIRLVGHCLGHANWSHYAGNMTLFLLLGPILEDKYGSGKLLLMIVITAVISGLLNILLFPQIALLGASGIVFMFIVLTSASCMVDDRIPLTMILIIVIYLGAEVMNALTKQDSISQFTHIIGGVCGAVFGLANSGKRGN